MAKPSQLPEWASGAAVVTPEPSGGKKAAGFILDERPPVNWINWLFLRIYQWCLYLSNLHGEVEFLNKTYDWLGAHSFAGGLALKGSHEVSYAPLPRTRTIILDQASAQPRNNATLQDDSVYFNWQSGASNAHVTYTFRLPHLAQLLRVRVGIFNGLSTNVTIHCWRIEAQTTTPGANVLVDLGSEVGNYAGAGVITHAVPSPPTTDGALHTYGVVVDFGSSGQCCSFCEIQFADPGPRNF